MAQHDIEELIQDFIVKLPIKATEIGWEKIGEDAQEFQQLITDYCQKQVTEANSNGHWWTHAKRLDAYGNYEHYCNCGYTARGSEAIKGHIKWKMAELSNQQPSREEES